jgi:hypothetical protein
MHLWCGWNLRRDGSSVFGNDVNQFRLLQLTQYISLPASYSCTFFPFGTSLLISDAKPGREAEAASSSSPPMGSRVAVSTESRLPAPAFFDTLLSQPRARPDVTSSLHKKLV